MLLLAIFFAAASFAQDQRALLIGINTYTPEDLPSDARGGASAFSNLDGTHNDVMAVQSLLTSRFGFGEDATGVFIFTRRAGVDTKVYQSSWNRDVLDGTGKSGLTLNLERGNVFHMDYSWYGYGSIAFKVVMPDANGVQRTVLAHTFDPSGVTSIQQPNLPIRVEVDNGTTATAQTAYVGGRQYSIIGRSRQTWRVTSQQRLAVGSIGTASWVPMLSVRRKAGTFLVESVRLHRVDLIADGDLIVGLWNNVTLGGTPSWGNLVDIDPNETVLESDVAATSISGGQLVNRFLAAGGTNKDRSLEFPEVEKEFDLIEQQPLTLAVKAVSGSNITASAILAMREEW